VRVYPGINLSVFKDPAEREQAKIVDDALRDQTAALSRSVFPGTQPAANPVPSQPPPGASPLPQPTAGDLLYGLITGSWAKLAIGASSTILTVSGGLPAWATVLSLLPAHDHSTAAQGGNIPETSITDGTLLARLAADETITGSWDFNNAFTRVIASFTGLPYAGVGFLLWDTTNAVQIELSSTQSSNGVTRLPNSSGTEVTLIGTNESVIVINKTLSTGTKLRVNAAGTSCVFQDASVTTKQLAIDLAGSTSSTLSVIDINSTAARTWTLQDVTGTIYQTGGTDVAVADGGTGASTATTGFNALSPVTTRGDLIVRDASNNVRLGIGTTGKFLRTDGTDPSWQNVAETDITDGTILARLAANEDVAGNWTFLNDVHLESISTGFDAILSVGTPTAARTYKLTHDLSGDIPIIGNDPPAVASGFLGKVDLTAQTANIATTNLSNTPPAGVYEVEVILMCTTADATAGTLAVTIGWTDNVGATTSTPITALTLAAVERTTGSQLLRVNSSNITYAVTVTGIYGTSQYAVYVRVTAKG
jgi:hypothetical protein